MIPENVRTLGCVFYTSAAEPPSSTIQWDPSNGKSHGGKYCVGVVPRGGGGGGMRGHRGMPTSCAVRTAVVTVVRRRVARRSVDTSKEGSAICAGIINLPAFRHGVKASPYRRNSNCGFSCARSTVWCARGQMVMAYAWFVFSCISLTATSASPLQCCGRREDLCSRQYGGGILRFVDIHLAPWWELKVCPVRTGWVAAPCSACRIVSRAAA